MTLENDYVFISYKHADELHLAKKISSNLNKLMIRTWIAEVNLKPDRRIKKIDSLYARIDKYAKKSSAIIVLWTKNSYDRHWIQAEAEIGLQNKKLLQLVLDDLDINDLYLPFRPSDVINLFGWDGSSGHTEWQNALRKLGDLICRPTLAELARVLDQDDLETKEQWARENQSDPYTTAIWEDSTQAHTILYDHQETLFIEQFEKLMNETRRVINSKLSERRIQFAGFLKAIQSENDMRFPDPVEIWEDEEIEAFKTWYNKHFGEYVFISPGTYFSAASRLRQLKITADNIQNKNENLEIEIQNNSKIILKLQGDLEKIITKNENLKESYDRLERQQITQIQKLNSESRSRKEITEKYNILNQKFIQLNKTKIFRTILLVAAVGLIARNWEYLIKLVF